MSKTTEKITEKGTAKKGREEVSKHATKQITKLATEKGAEDFITQAMSEITERATKKGKKPKTRKLVKLKKLRRGRHEERDPRYNQFDIEYTINEVVEEKTGKVIKQEESEKTLVKPELHGLNPEFLSKAPPRDWKEQIWDFLPKFEYWGYLLQDSIDKFNEKNPTRYRAVEYLVRHAQSDHNSWKTRFIALNKKEKWTELKQKATFEYSDPHRPHIQKATPKYHDQKQKGWKYCLVDTPLTAYGTVQATRAGRVFERLKYHGFPMPKRAFVSPLLRTMQTFRLAAKYIGIKPEQSYILFNLREKEEGNCADILIDEYTSQTKEPKEWTEEPKEWRRNRYTNYANHEHIYQKMPGKSQWYVESDADVQRRADAACEEIDQMNDGESSLLVSHSLFIQNRLKRLEDPPGKGTGSVNGTIVEGDPEATVLTKFMVGEADMLAILVEGIRPDEEAETKQRGDLITVDDRESKLKGALGDRRKTAFESLTFTEVPKPAQHGVRIEGKILEVDKQRSENRGVVTRYRPRGQISVH